MNKTYVRQNFENYPSDRTPLDEISLNKIDSSLDQQDDRIIVLDETKATKVDVSTLIKEVAYDRQTGILTFTRKNGASFTIDTPMEKIQTGIYYDPVTEMLTLPLIDGTTIGADLSRLITQYEFLESGTIAFSISSDGKVSAIVKEGSIEERHLRPDYLADIRVEEESARASAAAALASERNAKASEDAAGESAGNALASEGRAGEHADSAGSSAAAALDIEQAVNAKAIESADSAQESAISAWESLASAQASAASAGQSAASAGESAASAGQASASAAAAGTHAETAGTYAAASRSYAVGGTGTRDGEDADNAKKYAQDAKASADRAAEIADGRFVPVGEKGAAGGVATLDGSGKVPGGQLPSMDYIPTAEKGTAGGVASLDSTGKVPLGQISEDVGRVQGVKGNAESGYRTGNVNITPADIGAVRDGDNIYSRHIDGAWGEHDGDLYLQYRNSRPIHLGAGGAHTISGDGAQYSGNAASATNADTVDGYHASQSTGANTIVVRDVNGYAFLNYINSNTGKDENPAVSQIITTNGSDNYYRKASLQHVKNQMGLNNVNNTADSSKSVNYASSAGNADMVDGYHIAVVSSMPSSPDPNTVYFVKG